jgi:hypothetical protein
LPSAWPKRPALAKSKGRANAQKSPNASFAFGLCNAKAKEARDPCLGWATFTLQAKKKCAQGTRAKGKQRQKATQLMPAAHKQGRQKTQRQKATQLMPAAHKQGRQKTVNNTELDFLFATKEIKTFKKINDNNTLITYIPIVNKEICESHHLDYHKVILNEKNNKATSNVGVFQDVSIILASFVTSYARVYMHKMKLAILKGGGNIYYSDTDSIVTDLTLDQLKKELKNKIGNNIGQLKLENLLEEAYFISNKTYILLTKAGKEIIKAKGISADSLSLSDFKTMYLESQPIKGDKLSSNINYNKGSVLLQTKEVTID